VSWWLSFLELFKIILFSGSWRESEHKITDYGSYIKLSRLSFCQVHLAGDLQKTGVDKGKPWGTQEHIRKIRRPSMGNSLFTIKAGDLVNFCLFELD
jgi:hypothetical protein